MNDGAGKGSDDSWKMAAKNTSMGSLINWNVSKALENNPHIDLRAAIKSAQDRLEESSSDINSLLSRYPHERHLACALLAWQNLGHRDADSLYSFVTLNRSVTSSNTQKAACQSRFGSHAGPPSTFCSEHKPGSHEGMSRTYKVYDTASLGSGASLGPVVRLPVESKIVMPVHQCQYDKKPAPRQPPRKTKDVKSKIDAACCLNSECADRLMSMDAATNELRTRASRLAKREAQRVELLERAEAAWRDLETGYQRRLRVAEEKEYDIANQTAKLVQTRNEQKAATSALVADLKARSEVAEQERQQLAAVEKEVCARACERAKQAEQAAKSDAELAEQMCKASQLDRELLFKEEQSRRKQQAMEGAADSAQALLHEAERAMRAELAALRDQIGRVGEEHDAEEAVTAQLRQELDDLRKERNGLTEDLEGCQVVCDKRMKDQQDNLIKKRQQLEELKHKELECRCKSPVDAAVTVKRTPSLAAICRCTPEDQFGDSCSCTSLRSQLLSNLLADLFEGLQSELGDTGSKMPCQLLKCLEDKHKWDRVTPVKTNLRDYFSQLLLGELDIAIATSIEKYHAKWVGASCADKTPKVSTCDSKHSEDWQARALECKAQKMATKLAEQLFKEKAKELAQQAQNVLARQGRPPCECHPSSCCPSPPKLDQCDCASGRGCPSKGPAVYQCLVKPPSIRSTDLTNNDSATPKYLRRTLQDVTQLRMQIEDLNKNIIKREDLTMMEANIAKMVQFASVISPVPSLLEVREDTDKLKKDFKSTKSVKTVGLSKNNGISKSINKKKPVELINNINKSFKPASHLELIHNANKAFKPSLSQNRTKASGKDFKKPTQQFAVNLCLWDPKTKLPAQTKVFQQSKNASKYSSKLSRDNVSQLSTKGQSKQIVSVSPELGSFDEACTLPSCVKNCACFHKKPSNISIDKLLETLSKWKDDLVELPEKQNVTRKQENAKSILQISQQTSCVQEEKPIKMMDDKSVENLELVKVCSKNVKALCDSETLTDTIEKVENSATTKIVMELPAVTESEYMGAINLEKSAELLCACENKPNDGATCINPQFPFKCIKSKKCMCKTCISAPMHHEKGIDIQSTLVPHYAPIKSRTIFDCNTNLDINIPTKENVNHKVGDVAVSVKTSLSSILKYSSLFESDYENNIKCLGVTLINVTSDIFLPKSLDLKHKLSVEKTNLCDTCSVATLNRTANKSQAYHRNIELSKTPFGVVQDEFVEVQDFNNGVAPKEEPCICCPNFDVDGCKDLEVNTFQLLEEHLKGKLDDFKHFFCKSSCIPNGDEEKLFTDILQRVKQLISDSTNTPTCNCVENSKVKGSWNRAYSLLQEYLKTKIERVKCQCKSKNKSKENIALPNVLNNINYLIENDFKRLKGICKCKINKPSHETELNGNGQCETSSDNDINDHKKAARNALHLRSNTPTSEKKETLKSTRVNFLEPKNPDSLTHSISAQVSPYHSMETKSCNAIEKHNKYSEVQTTDGNTKTLTMDGFNDTKSVSNCCTHTHTANRSSEPDFVNLLRNNDNPMVDTTYLPSKADSFPNAKSLKVSNKESDIQMEIERLFVERNKNTVNKKARNASLSYIGYTMNCCCDTALGCVCTKSTVRAHKDKLKIKDIWKTYMKNNNICHNVSYMLDSTPDKIPKTVNYVELREHFYTKLSHDSETVHGAKSNICESEMSANIEKDVILIESRENVDVTHEMTNTIEKNQKPKSDSSFECCDLTSTPSRRKSERFSILKQNKNRDVYYPEDAFLQFDNSDTAINDNSLNLTDSMTTNCDCKMVPICHVKMLVENIEDKLVNAQCTCDSLSSKVCPVHSQRVID